jgi:hypothetical protein
MLSLLSSPFQFSGENYARILSHESFISTHAVLPNLITPVSDEVHRPQSYSLCNFQHSFITSCILISDSITTLFANIRNLLLSADRNTKLLHPRKTQERFLEGRWVNGRSRLSCTAKFEFLVVFPKYVKFVTFLQNFVYYLLTYYDLCCILVKNHEHWQCYPKFTSGQPLFKVE